MFKRRREIPTLERLNIVPIMDAIFIFIFFLLFSAQFIKIFEIETEAPIVSEVPQNVKFDEEPLNLVIKIFKNKIEVITGVDQIIKDTYYKIDADFKEKFKRNMIDLRKKYPNDDQVILAPEASIEYNEIISLIDLVQTIPNDENLVVTVKGQENTLKKIFTQVVLESMNEI